MVENTDWLQSNRTIFLTGDIDETSLVPVMQLIVQANVEDRTCKETLQGYVAEPIKIFISSGGGEVYPMWGLVDLMRTSRTPIITYCVGMAMSAAFNIFISGHKRFITEHSVLMCHQMSMELASMTVQDIKEYNNWLQYAQKIDNKFLTENTELSEHEIEDIMKNKIDKFYSAERAVKLGIADEIITDDELWSFKIQ